MLVFGWHSLVARVSASGACSLDPLLPYTVNFLCLLPFRPLLRALCITAIAPTVAVPDITS